MLSSVQRDFSGTDAPVQGISEMQELRNQVAWLSQVVSARSNLRTPAKTVDQSVAMDAGNVSNIVPTTSSP